MMSVVHVSWLLLYSWLAVLLLTSAPAQAVEPAPVQAEQPEEPRAVFRRSGINSFVKGVMSNIVLRGYQRENLAITFDGASYVGAVPFRVDAGPFLMNNSDVRRIVVTKGPYNLTTPGALGGSIEVISPDNPPRPAARTVFSYGSYDTVDGTAWLAIGSDTADFSAGYRGRYGGVPEAGDGVPLTATPYPNPNNNYRPGTEDQTMYRSDSVWFKAGINPAQNSRIELSYQYLQGSDIKVPTQNMDLADEQIHRLNGRLSIRNLSPLVRELTLQGWWNRARSSIDDALRETADPSNSSLPYRTALTRSYAVANQLETDLVGARAAVKLALGSGRLHHGLDFYQRDWNGSYSSLLKQGATPWQYYDNQPLIPDVTTRNLGLFLVYETPLTTTVRTVVAARGDLARSDANGLSPERIAALYQQYYPGQGIPTGQEYADWGANAQLFWKVIPELELYLKAGRAVRLPDPHELYTGQVRQGSNLIGNPFLRPTALHQVDLGGVWSRGGHRIELLLFYGQADDFIMPVRRTSSTLTQARSAENIKAVIWGVEADASVRLAEQLQMQLMLTYNQGENRSSGSPLAEMPPLRGRVGLRYDYRRFFATISEVLVARQNRFDPAQGERSQPGYAVTDLQLGGRWQGFTATLAVNNLFDLRYVMPLYYQRDPIAASARIPENGRTITGTISYRY